MTCIEVREHLTEHSLGVLGRSEAAEVDRHLEWCAGCRKEAAELQEGTAAVGLALPVAKPPSSLENRIVESVMTVAGRSRPPVRHRFRALVATTLAAAMLAVGAMGWAVAERSHVQSLKEQVSQKNKAIAKFTETVKSFRGKTLGATLLPAQEGGGSGSALIFSAATIDDSIFIDVVLPAGVEGPLSVQLVDDKGAMKLGDLQRTVEGDWLMYRLTPLDLAKVVSVTILDAQSGTVMTGTVRDRSG